MTLPGATIFAVHERLRRLAERPPLFSDRMTPARISRRLDRVRRWCGPCLTWIINHDREAPRHPYRRGGARG